MSDTTPGPWFVHDYTELGHPKDPPDITVSCDHPAEITVAVIGRGLTASHAEMIANARLIAEAPALYAALEWFAGLTDEGFADEGRTMLKTARAALARARGETP